MSLLANSNAIETGGYQISRSVRLRSSANAYLNRTLTTPTNNKIFTYSLWAKRGTLGSAQMLLSGGDGSSNNDAWFGFNSSDQLVFASLTGGAYKIQVNTSAVFRDPSAFYSIVLFVDNTQATNSNGIKIYVNGVNQTLTYTTWVQNGGSSINTANPHYIGRLNYSAIQYLDGYLTEINFIDGQALTPSSFGETDLITGVWVAKKYTGTYGTNGFYLNFSDNSAATSTTIGKDYSGNGNNWTPNNISVTAGATYDSMLDVPSGNGYADGGNGRGNYCTWNPLDKNTNVTIANGNLDATYTGTVDVYGCFSTFSVSSGKWYAEFTATGLGGSNYPLIGIRRSSNYSAASIPETYVNLKAGTSDNRGSSGPTFTAFVDGDVLGIAFDADTGEIFFAKNGTWLNSGNPAAGTGEFFSGLTDGPFKFGIGMYSSRTAYANFGQRPFSYTPPTGFKALNTTNLSDPTVKNGSSYFNPVLYTGNSSNDVTVTNTFASDLVWLKSRSNADNHYLQDIVRGFGASKSLSSNTTGSEGFNGGSPATQNITTTSTSLRLQGQDFTQNTYTYVAWNWKANGTGVTNTAGTITSTVSANTTAGFSVVTYTGNGGSGTKTVGHGIGVAPAMVIIKNRSSATAWPVYHKSLTSTSYYIELNTTAAQQSYGSTFISPGSTTITIAADSSLLNTNTSNYVAYCFAPVAGYSAFGSYTGNGSTDGPFVYCGFRPRWLLIKGTTSLSLDQWMIWDTARNTYNVASNSLQPNSSGSENTARIIDILSNGFKPREGDAKHNLSNETYIYAAFSEVGFKYALAR